MPLQHLIHYYLARFHLALRRHAAAAVAHRQALESFRRAVALRPSLDKR